jgi:predicted ATP-grasp superfamily ATP-dependent carboligase
VVINLFYTGVGIGRSLGSRGVPVIGLTAHRAAYGNFSRYITAVRCADSSSEPERLLPQVIELGRTLNARGVLFPTRDSDLVFLDQYREELEPYFHLVVPPAAALRRCLDKWETHTSAVRAGVPAPKSVVVAGEEDLPRVGTEVGFPCVVKPLASHHWRSAANWALVGARKAIGANSADDLRAAYRAVAAANRRVLVQECIPGADDALIVAACYIDKQGAFRGGFNVQKLVQVPSGFGTGCIVQSADRPELMDRTIALLRAMEFTGVAEVEYKWDERDQEYKLIEVNPRPWDQHSLGAAAGIDLIRLAYDDHAGLPLTAQKAPFVERKWIAEDTLLLTTLRLLWNRQAGGVRTLWRNARGKRVYGIWSARDPLPLIACAATLGAELAAMGLKAVGRGMAGTMGSVRPRRAALTDRGE